MFSLVPCSMLMTCIVIAAGAIQDQLIGGLLTAPPTAMKQERTQLSSDKQRETDTQTEAMVTGNQLDREVLVEAALGTDKMTGEQMSATGMLHSASARRLLFLVARMQERLSNIHM